MLEGLGIKKDRLLRVCLTYSTSKAIPNYFLETKVLVVALRVSTSVI